MFGAAEKGLEKCRHGCGGKKIEPEFSSNTCELGLTSLQIGFEVFCDASSMYKIHQQVGYILNCELYYFSFSFCCASSWVMLGLGGGVLSYT